jgi:hypothetical protein
LVLEIHVGTSSINKDGSSFVGQLWLCLPSPIVISPRNTRNNLIREDSLTRKELLVRENTLILLSVNVARSGIALLASLKASLTFWVGEILMTTMDSLWTK